MGQLLFHRGSGGGGGGGSAYDFLSTLTGSEISITGTQTATISRMHVCSGTSADYTVTLPSASGNADKFVCIRMASSLTKLVTVSGSGFSQVLWANESVIVKSNGSNWSRFAGDTIPHSARIEATAAENLTNGAFTELALGSVVYDVGSLTGTANKITIRRGGNYLINVGGTITTNTNPNTTVKPGIHSIYKGGVEWKRVFRGPPDIYGYMGGTNSIKTVCAAGDVLRMACYVEGGTGPTTVYEGGYDRCGLSVMEIPSW